MKLKSMVNPVSMACFLFGICCVGDAFINCVILITEPVLKTNYTVLNISAWCIACLTLASIVLTLIMSMHAFPQAARLRERLAKELRIANNLVQLLAVISLALIVWLGFLKPAFVQPMLRNFVELAVWIFVYSHWHIYDCHQNE